MCLDNTHTYAYLMAIIDHGSFSSSYQIYMEKSDNMIKASWWLYKNQNLEETLLNQQKTSIVQGNDLEDEGMVFTEQITEHSQKVETT